MSLLSEWLPENTHPELKYIEAKWASLMSYDLTVDRLKDILPINNALNAATIRNHLISVAKRQEAELAEQPDFLDKSAYDNKQLPRPGKPMVVTSEIAITEKTILKSLQEKLTLKIFKRNGLATFTHLKTTQENACFLYLMLKECKRTNRYHFCRMRLII